MTKELTFKPVERISQLQRGDIVRHRYSGNSWVVSVHISEERAIAADVIELANPDEWLVGVWSEDKENSE